MDEYTLPGDAQCDCAGCANYYRHTSLLSDIEIITRYTWHRYLLWLRRKHKGSRKHRLITSGTWSSMGEPDGPPRYAKGTRP